MINDGEIRRQARELAREHMANLAVGHRNEVLGEVPHSINFGFEQELSCGILANRCYAYVPTCLAGISFGTRI